MNQLKKFLISLSIRQPSPKNGRKKFVRHFVNTSPGDEGHGILRSGVTYDLDNYNHWRLYIPGLDKSTILNENCYSTLE
jgi:hypothetical protein